VTRASRLPVFFAVWGGSFILTSLLFYLTGLKEVCFPPLRRPSAQALLLLLFFFHGIVFSAPSRFSSLLFQQFLSRRPVAPFFYIMIPQQTFLAILYGPFDTVSPDLPPFSSFFSDVEKTKGWRPFVDFLSHNGEWELSYLFLGYVPCLFLRSLRRRGCSLFFLLPSQGEIKRSCRGLSLLLPVASMRRTRVPPGTFSAGASRR